MPGVFISYRRSDTLPWAGRLFDGLVRCFGKGQVFMDINGGILRGADFQKTLDTALTDCDALLALVGPTWLTCTRQDGTRRLDAPDDWVRREIASCLARGVPVVPVLLGGTTVPAAPTLPEDLRPLANRQGADVRDTDWHHHVGELVKDLVRQTRLTLVHAPGDDDVDSANTGIRLLSDLISSNRAVADAVGRSKEVIENTYRQVGRLELFKTLHDALHTIEFECLRPMQASVTNRVRPFRIRFSTEARRMRDCLTRGDLDAALQADITDALDAAEAAFEAAVAAPDDAATAQLLGELSTMVSRLPAQLDSGISAAARDLSLDRLVELMGAVRETLGASAADPAVASFLQGIDALLRLRDELGQRVQEHGQLQRLDGELRLICAGGMPTGALAGGWRKVKKVRARLAVPVSAELQAVNGDLVELEAEIDRTLTAGDEASAVDQVHEYFRSIGSVFRDVDTSLKDFCLRLGAVSQPLKAVLDVI